MNHKCICGDPYCKVCGNIDLVRIELEQDKLLDRLMDFGLSVEEYSLVCEAGLAAVKETRFKKSKNISSFNCPKCGKRGQRRRGVGFEHEMICMGC
jgi:predicted RNA-binding Zn-ribbon protein involved in translation (DUF1610 family)